MICTIRIPDVLQAMIDQAAGKGNRSEWILEACRMRLDSRSSLVSIGAAMDNAPCDRDITSGTKSPLDQPIDPSFSVGIAPRQDLLAKLRASIAAIESKPIEVLPPIVEITMCHKTWWEDGEQYECLMDKGHKIAKCGQRGMVRNITP